MHIVRIDGGNAATLAYNSKAMHSTLVSARLITTSK